MSDVIDLFADFFYPLLIGLIMFLEKGKLKDALFVFGKEMASKDEQRDKHVYQSMSLMTNPQSHGIEPDNKTPPTTPTEQKIDDLIVMMSDFSQEQAVLVTDVKILIDADKDIYIRLDKLELGKVDRAT